MIYVYAIAEAPAVVPSDLRVVERAGLAAVVSDEVLEAGPEAFLAHDGVVQALMATQPVLPTRFGMTFATDADVAAVLEERAETFRESLTRIRGCVELSVRPPDADDPLLAELARAQRRTPRGDAMAYLVPTAEKEAFESRAGELGLSCTGPWPPYSFVGEPPALRNGLPTRINADPASVEKGLVQLVLTIVELLRQLMERQALHRIDAGGLDPEQIARLDETFMLLEQRMEELKEHFGLEASDLNLDLGPLGRLL